MQVARGSAGKGGMKSMGQSKGKVSNGYKGQKNLGKALAQKLIAMRLAGATPQECDEFAEMIYQEIKRIEGEIANG